MSEPEREPRAVWPPGTTYPAGELLLAHCSKCELEWRVHRDLNGFRLRCRCGAWVDVPRLAVTGPRAQLPGAESPEAALPATASPTATLRLAARSPEPAATRTAEEELRAIHLRPFDETRALKRRTILECVLLALCFWGPPIALQLLAPPNDVPRYLPIASTIASLLALLVYRGARDDVATGWVEPRWRYWLEAIAMTGVALLLAAGYGSFLETVVPGSSSPWIAEVREQAGIGMAFFSIAICPGIFEELAFRGLLQGRLTRLLGATQGLFVTAALFALAHGPQLGLPIHAALGLYLGSLRSRSGSVLPGMLCHIAYNGALVVLS